MTFVSPHTGEKKTVKWVRDGLVQFDNGTCCSLSDFAMFYGKPLRMELKANFGQ